MLHKVCQNTGFPWPVFSHIWTETTVRKNPYSSIFYAVYLSYRNISNILLFVTNATHFSGYALKVIRLNLWSFIIWGPTFNLKFDASDVFFLTLKTFSYLVTLWTIFLRVSLDFLGNAMIAVFFFVFCWKYVCFSLSRKTSVSSSTSAPWLMPFFLFRLYLFLVSCSFFQVFNFIRTAC